MATQKLFTRSEIAENQELDKVLLILHDKVFNVHSFLNEHPGGEEVLMDHKGKDASEDFDDVGHSMDAMELMKKYQIGELIESEKTNQAPKKGWVAGYNKQAHKELQGSMMPMYFIGGFIVLLAVLYYLI